MKKHLFLLLILSLNINASEPTEKRAAKKEIQETKRGLVKEFTASDIVYPGNLLSIPYEKEQREAYLQKYKKTHKKFKSLVKKAIDDDRAVIKNYIKLISKLIRVRLITQAKIQKNNEKKDKPEVYDSEKRFFVFAKEQQTKIEKYIYESEKFHKIYLMYHAFMFLHLQPFGNQLEQALNIGYNVNAIEYLIRFPVDKIGTLIKILELNTYLVDVINKPLPIISKL